MKQEKKMVRWTNEERALLAHFIRVAIEENGKSNKEALEFASIKLGRSKNACYWQYHTYISKGNYKPINNIEQKENQEFSQTFEEEALIQLRAELANSQDLINKLIKERTEIYDIISIWVARNNWNLLSIFVYLLSVSRNSSWSTLPPKSKVSNAVMSKFVLLFP